MPSKHGSTRLSVDLWRIWSRAFFLRRASGTYSKFAGRRFAKKSKFECALDMSLDIYPPPFVSSEKVPMRSIIDYVKSIAKPIWGRISVTATNRRGHTRPHTERRKLHGSMGLYSLETGEAGGPSRGVQVRMAAMFAHRAIFRRFDAVSGGNVKMASIRPMI